MTTVADAVAAPADYELHGKTQVLHPLNFREWGRIERWMREEIVSVAKESLKDDTLSEFAMRMIMREAHAAATRTSIQSDDALEGLLGSLEGMLRIAHMSLRKQDDTLTVDKVDALLANDMGALADIVEAIYAISFPASYKKAKGKSEAEPANPPAVAKPTPA